MSEPVRMIRVYVTNAIRTSGGTGPGWLDLPIDEGNDLIARRLACTADPAEALNAEMKRTMGLTAPRRG